MTRKKIIHMFQWKLSDIKDNLQEIKEAGFDWVQISPIQKGKLYGKRHKPDDS